MRNLAYLVPTVFSMVHGTLFAPGRDRVHVLELDDHDAVGRLAADKAYGLVVAPGRNCRRGWKRSVQSHGANRPGLSSTMAFPFRDASV